MGRVTLCPLPLLIGLAVSISCSGALASSGFAHITLNKEPNDHLAALAQISDSTDSLERTFFSPAHRRAATQLKAWMEEAGMDTWVDAIGNVHGRVNSSDPAAAATVMASHYDTVLDGGKFDGALGIIVGIAAIKEVVLQAAARAGVDLAASMQPGGHVPEAVRMKAQTVLRAPMHLIAFTDEEGIRFKSTFLGSRAVAGSLVPNGMLDAQDRQGHSLRQVLEAEQLAAGQGSTPAEAIASSLVLPPQSVREYVEVHIEQGPVLEGLGTALGAVSAIAGQTRLWVVVNGTQGHAGTVPMRGRADALAAGAHIVSVIERTCGGGPAAAGTPSEASGDDEMLVCTVGELRVWPGASNVIPGSVQLSVDIRAKADLLRTSIVQHVKGAVSELCAARGVSCSVAQNHDAPAVLSDPGLVQDLVAAISASQPLLQQALLPAGGAPAGVPQGGGQCGWGGAGTEEAQDSGAAACASGGGQVPVLVSGAGHDAMAMAEVTKVAMMFVRCRGGVSHSPLEHTEQSDVAAASAALGTFLAGRVL